VVQRQTDRGGQQHGESVSPARLDAGLLLGLLGWPPTRHWKGQQGPIWMVFLLFNGIGFLFWLPTWT
jgi:hypothetical protein